MDSKKRYSPTVVVIAGPTAVGKTALAVELAQHFHTEILSADSRQCFRQLDIGVAKPSADELKLVHHYFINSHSIDDEVNTAVYEQYALQCLDRIFAKANIAVVVGGTGLYIKALCEGVDDMPPVSASVRNSIIHDYEQKGLQWLQHEVKIKDPLFWENAEQQNPRRLMRALEIVEATGQSITTFRKGVKIERDFNVIKIALELPREDLYDRINRRVDMMIGSGLEAEARKLFPYKSLNALQTVGYSEWFDFFDGNFSHTETIEKIKTNTRHYAKRQLTWFKKDKEFQWFVPSEKENILSCIKSSIE